MNFFENYSGYILLLVVILTADAFRRHIRDIGSKLQSVDVRNRVKRSHETDLYENVSALTCYNCTGTLETCGRERTTEDNSYACNFPTHWCIMSQVNYGARVEYHRYCSKPVYIKACKATNTYGCDFWHGVDYCDICCHTDRCNTWEWTYGISNATSDIRGNDSSSSSIIPDPTAISTTETGTLTPSETTETQLTTQPTTSTVKLPATSNMTMTTTSTTSQTKTTQRPISCYKCQGSLSICGSSRSSGDTTEICPAAGFYCMVQSDSTNYERKCADPEDPEIQDMCPGSVMTGCKGNICARCCDSNMCNDFDWIHSSGTTYNGWMKWLWLQFSVLLVRIITRI